MSGDEDVPQWKANLGAKAQSAFQEHSRRRRKDWMKLIYSSSLTPEQILRDDTSNPKSQTDAMDEDDDDQLFTVKSNNTVVLGTEEELDMTKEKFDMLRDSSHLSDLRQPPMPS